MHLGSSVCVRTYVYMCVVKKKTCLFASYSLEIDTKTISAACSLNLSTYRDIFSAVESLFERLSALLQFISLVPRPYIE